MAGAKEQRWFWEAEQLWVTKGLSYDQVIAHVEALGGSISKGTLANWNKKGDWQAKRQRYLQTAQGLSPELRKQLEEKIRLMLADAEQLSAENLNVALKLLRLIKSIGQEAPDLKITALEIMGKFAGYVDHNCDDSAIREELSFLVGGFLAEVERQNV